MNHIWMIDNWKHNLSDNATRRVGIHFRYEKLVDPEVRRACIEFASWLRSQYYFPLRVSIYVKGEELLRTMDGQNDAFGTFFEPISYHCEPYIRIATGDYTKRKLEWGQDNALASILVSIAHELTHYFQWINGIRLTDIGIERQATRYARLIIDEYAITRDHP